jgi:cytochrome c oxidase subunit 2
MDFLPPNGALHGIALDKLLGWNLVLVFWLFVAAHILIVAAFLFRRAREKKIVIPTEAEEPAFRRPPLKPLLVAEFLTLLALMALYLAMDITGHKLWAASREQAATCGRALQVEVTGVQFQWYFRYPGLDGVYGVTKPALVSAPTGNPLGLDRADPRAADDIVSSILVLPAGQPVDITLRSQDVIHGFFVPGMRLKQDAIPGMAGMLRFTPATAGNYDILCSQVCGLGHWRMQARLRVVTPAQFDTWLAAREKAALGASAARGGQ